ncbi:WD40 repeat domain-containing protein [Fischerella sp. PCC 9605]|uniref:WD40 repeat domain-containing protein n=1 Tax=Fischerella sp. PCC 9605 TaxID=1173024 RepID=UPI0009E28486|nr:WD40 repeat domain-containing protein [Fischerella sp. PCC 9605]
MNISYNKYLIAGAVSIAVLSQIPSVTPATAKVDVKPNSQATSTLVHPQLVYILKEHSGSVKSLAFAPDNQTLVSGGSENDGVIRLWSAKTGKRIGIIRKAQKTTVESVLISPNGLTLASCSNDYTINLWNLKTNKFSRSFIGHSSNVLSLAVTPDGKILASGGLDGIRLWDLIQQRPLATLVHYNNISKIAISPGGQILASGDTKGMVKLWNLNSGQLIREFTAHTKVISGIAFTPDDQTLVTASHDGTIKLWNAKTGDLVSTLTADKNWMSHRDWINAIAINPNGRILASGGKQGIVKLWDLTTGKLLNTLDGHTDWVSAIAFSPDGQMLASGGYDKKIMIWRSHPILDFGWVDWLHR